MGFRPFAKANPERGEMEIIDTVSNLIHAGNIVGAVRLSFMTDVGTMEKLARVRDSSEEISENDN